MVAEKLGLTVAELRDRMTPVELLGWQAFFSVRPKLEEEARQKQKAQMRRR